MSRSDRLAIAHSFVELAQAGNSCIFKASALWADAFYKLICSYVCVFVCLSVCVFTFEVPFKCVFSPTSRSQMLIFFRDLESLGEKKLKEVVSHLKTFTNKGSKIAALNFFFFVNLGLINH